MLENWRREREVRRVLRSLTRQRVCGFDDSVNAWIVERALPSDQEALRTCEVRGWVETTPYGALEKKDPNDPTARAKVRTRLYRLTDSGWNAIHFTHAWVVATFVVALVTLFATGLGITLSRYGAPTTGSPRPRAATATRPR